MAQIPENANDPGPDNRPSPLSRRLLIFGWVGWLLAVFSLWLQWRLNVYQPRTWLWLPLAVGGGILSGRALVRGLIRTVRGPRRVAAFGHAIGGGMPLVLWGLLTVYMVNRAPWRGGIVLNTISNLGTLAAADLMTLHASVRYSHRLESEHLVMYYGDPVNQPEADIAAMEEHLARMETVLSKQQHSKIVWVRGSALGQTGVCARDVAIGSDASPARELDRHELAHALIFQFTGPDTDPPTVLVEGWAMSQQGKNPRQGIAAAWSRAELISEKKADRCLHELASLSWYYQPVRPAYDIGGPWVDQLLRRYGNERFLELYNAARPQSFAADCQRILGHSLDDLEQGLWEEVEYPFQGDVEVIKRAVPNSLPPGTKGEQVEAWSKKLLGIRPTVLEEVRHFGSYAGRSIPQMAGWPEGEVAALARITIPLPPFDLRGKLAPNHVWVYFRLNSIREVMGYYFITFRELAELEAHQSG